TALVTHRGTEMLAGSDRAFGRKIPRRTDERPVATEVRAPLRHRSLVRSGLANIDVVRRTGAVGLTNKRGREM
ncbi:MAG TPA: hypothetical protein VMU95_26415, partial [Trebonia sp.]|nr:hypothetical protein [Trebonia sp.]